MIKLVTDLDQVVFVDVVLKWINHHKSFIWIDKSDWNDVYSCKTSVHKSVTYCKISPVDKIQTLAKSSENSLSNMLVGHDV